MKKKQAYMIAAALTGILLYYVFTHLLYHRQADRLHYYRSFDRTKFSPLRPLHSDSLTYPYLSICDSDRYTTLTIRVDSVRRWVEVYQHCGDYIFSLSRAYEGHDSSFRSYRYIRRDTVITYLYKGDSLSHPDEDHYLVSVCVETDKRKVDYHLYPFLYMLHPTSDNVTATLPADVLDDVLICDYHIANDILKLDCHEQDNAMKCNTQKYLLYDLRLCPAFYVDYIAHDLLIQ